ncbi:hypothetical protein RHMOL_Rhmol13G0051600 [Rhododendron molle]|uniref:Uncharacterized protein n=1 Tax=Rhododendron molle TaxID=49168 RepID=A0ACC0L4N3_RHOML|nr:hypothetical protein RHMOL_Rhmol13G0051600 [Rhododendron molle]
MRRRSETETRDPPKIRSSSVRDVIRAKRVKFMDPDSECQPNVRPDEPAVLNEPTRDPAWISEKLKNIRDNSTSSFLVEKRRPITKSLFLSPLANASTNSGVAVGCILACFNEDFARLDQAIIIIPSDFLLTSYNAEAANIVDKCSDKYLRSPLSVEKVIPIDLSFLFSPLGGASKTSGTECLDGVFSGKRKRLRQWVANTSFPNTEEYCSEGFAESSACQCCRNEKPRQMRTETKFSSYAFPELDTGDKDCHWTPRRDLLGTEYGCYSDDVCNRSAENLEIVPSEWDTKGCDSPLSRHASRSHFQFGKKKFRADSEVDTPSMITIQDPYFCSNVENYESTAARHIKGLNDFLGMDESVNGRGPSTLLLGWDVDSCQDQGVLSITKRNAEMNYIMATSWDDHQQSLDNCSVESELDTSSFLFSYPFQFTSLPHPHSAPFSNVNEEKFLLAELKHFPLSLPCTPTCHNLLKDCDTYDTCDGSSTFSPLNHQWVLRKVFIEKHHRDMEPFLHPSGLGFDLGWTHLSISSFSDLYSPSYEGSQSPSKESPCSYILTEEQHEDCFYSSNYRQNIPHFSEDTLNIHEHFSANSWIPVDKEISTPVLLNSSSWLRTEEDISYDDGKRIYI